MGDDSEGDGCRDFAEIGADMPDEEDVVFDDAMREADAAALAALMSNEAFLARCRKCCGESNAEGIQSNHRALDGAAVGEVVEKVVTTYGAPHLRPVAILE
ncbi:unnamed protein product [Prorocentrum cordatum]|nr:unnamed protein product [Polarella glacialis]